ncbi:MAG: sirohydrochlorin chelatase [Pseudanabaenaceae cyanobacterium]
MPNYLTPKFQPVTYPDAQRLLIAHGSNLPLALAQLQTLASQTQSQLALWMQPDTITAKIELLLANNCRPIVVMPYFLFAGKTTTAIAELIAPYQAQYPNRIIYLDVPFRNCEIAHLILTEIIAPTSQATG